MGLVRFYSRDLNVLYCRNFLISMQEMNGRIPISEVGHVYDLRQVIVIVTIVRVIVTIVRVCTNAS
jgi:hypothetical protein